MRTRLSLPWLSVASVLALGMHAAGCGDNGSTTSTGSNSSSSSSSGDVSSSSSSSSTGGMGGSAGTGGNAGMGGSGGAGGGVPIICQPNMTTSCYSGPMGTQDVGLCVGGKWTCNAEGTAYGPCMGEILPIAENCATPSDENCNGTGPDCGVAIWSKRFGDFDGQYGRAIAADADGNVYVTGVFYRNLDFGMGPFTATSLDGFLVKFDPLGNVLWTKQIGGSGSEQPISLAIDGAGNVVVAGNFSNTVDFGGGPLVASDVDMFVAKYDAMGQHLWSKRFGNLDVQSARAMTIDSQNNILIGGDFAGSISFGGPTMTATSVDLFALKLDSNGNHVWSKQFSHADPNQPELLDVATDAAGNSVFAGIFFGTVNLGGVPLTSAGSYDTFLVKLGPTGDHLWSKRYGDGLDQSPNGVGFDEMGNLFVAGSFKGSIDLGGGTLTSAGNDDFFVARLDGNGNHVWSKRFGDTQQQFVTDLGVTKSGDLTFVVTMGGTVNLGGGPLTSAGSLDIGFARFDANGNHQWSHRVGDSAQQTSHAITFDPGGHILLTGELAGSVDFGTGVLTSAGSSDLVVAKLAP